MRLRRLLLSAEERGGNPRRGHGGISACCLRISGQLYQCVNQKNLRAFVCFLCVHFISALCGKKCASSYRTQPLNSTHEPRENYVHITALAFVRFRCLSGSHLCIAGPLYQFAGTRRTLFHLSASSACILFSVLCGKKCASSYGTQTPATSLPR